MLFATSFQALAQQKKLKHHLTEEERKMMPEYLKEVQRKASVSVPIEGVRPIAEFEPSQGVLISYPLGIPLSLVAEMSEDIMVTTIVNNQSQENQVRNQYQSEGVNLSNCNFIYARHDSYWTRDYGPMFIANNDNIEIVDFTYNRPRPNDNKIPEKLANTINTNVHRMDLLHCGGNYMSDGVNVAVSTDLVWEENSTKSKEEINQIMKSYLGISKYHVTDDPLGAYIKHVDCWGKFLDVDKILITEVPTSNPNYSKYEDIVKYFESQTSAWGNKYQVFRVYAPNGEPYTNSLILNDKVLVPITGSSNSDAAAIQAYKKAMPGYEVLGFTGTWQTTDALHCRIHEIADTGMLDIIHKPLFGKIQPRDSYLIEAKIKAYSKQNVYQDSIKVYYRVGNNQSYKSLKMTSMADGMYTANIPKQDSGTTISYYIHAADKSGRSENHPYIGEDDPHVFSIDTSDIVVAPVADFSASNTIIDTGQEIQFTDISQNNPISWVWSFEGGTPVSSSVKNPKITYNVPGTYKVSLTVTNSAGTDSISKVDFITVKETTITYCESKGNDASYEWISNVQVGDFTKNSGTSSGYSDYTSDIITMTPNSDVAISVTPGFQSTTYSENWKIWIDFNKNGNFSDAGEEVFSGKGKGVMNGTISIPNITVNTRIRISMSYQDSFSHCGSFNYGEVEDYQVAIGGNKNLKNFENISNQGVVFPNPNQGSFYVKLDGKAKAKAIILYNLIGQKMYQEKIQSNKGELLNVRVDGLSKGIYILKVLLDGNGVQTIPIQIDVK